MYRLILCLLVLVAAVWTGVKIAADPGYVLLAYQQWTLETPLWFAFLTTIAAFIVFYAVLRLLRNLGRLPRRLRTWRSRRRARAANQLTNQGLLALVDGKWSKAEKKLNKAANYTDLAWLNYLGAARAAYEQSNKDRKDYYLQKASSIKSAEVAVGLEQAKFQIEQQQYEQALATLQRLHHLVPKQTYIIRLLLRVCSKLNDWQTILSLLPAAKKLQVLSEDKLHDYEVKAYQALLKRTAIQADHQALKERYAAFPKALQKDAALLHTFVQLLIAQKQDAEAELLLRKYLNKTWNEELVYDYGLIDTRKPHDQLATAEGWLKGHEQNAVLLLTLGRLCMRSQLWGKARSYFETSIAIQAKPETYKELAKLFEQLDDKQQAYQTYQQGLDLILSQVSD